MPLSPPSFLDGLIRVTAVQSGAAHLHIQRPFHQTIAVAQLKPEQGGSLLLPTSGHYTNTAAWLPCFSGT
jgi:hypothetical protein